MCRQTRIKGINADARQEETGADIPRLLTDDIRHLCHPLSLPITML